MTHTGGQAGAEGAGTREGGAPSSRSLAGELQDTAAVGLWARGWTAARDARIGAVRVDLLCRRAGSRTASESGVALLIRTRPPSPDEAEATTAALDAAGVRTVWFAAEPFTPPASRRPAPSFRLAARTAADAIAILPGSSVALRFGDAVDALFDGRIQHREHTSLVGPWHLAIYPVRLRCWRCGIAVAAATPRAVRRDNHNRWHHATAERAVAMAAASIDAVPLADPAGRPIRAAKLAVSDCRPACRCPDCEAPLGAGMLGELGKAGAALATRYATVAAVDETTAGLHWCADAWSATGTWCAKKLSESGGDMTGAVTGTGDPEFAVRTALELEPPM